MENHSLREMLVCSTIIIVSIILLYKASSKICAICEDRQPKESTLRKDFVLPRQYGLHVVEIDGHEYIYVLGCNGCAIEHKADCKKEQSHE